MSSPIRRIDELPHRNATQIKNHWREVTDQVRATGSVAVTHHDKVEWVVMDADTYRELSGLAAEAKLRQADAALTANFDRRLVELQAADARGKVDATMGLKGDLTKVANRPRAGRTF